MADVMGGGAGVMGGGSGGDGGDENCCPKKPPPEDYKLHMIDCNTGVRWVENAKIKNWATVGENGGAHRGEVGQRRCALWSRG
ncbi:hypothetical protein LINPERPRIM_LOCUS37439 [Linum perenne]